MWPTQDFRQTAYRPGREQNLFIGQMKHLYCLKDGTLKEQRKPLDRRIPGKTLITRFVLFDVDTQTVYGECHTDATNKDLAGFLARAWSVKPDHPMRGVPGLLNVPKLVFKDDNYRHDIELVKCLSGVTLGALPTGFGGGVHAVKQFDNAVNTLICDVRLRSLEPNLALVQACSAGISNRIIPVFGSNLNERWAAVPPAPDTFFAAIDKLYQTPGAWRLGAFELVIKGLRAGAGA